MEFQQDAMRPTLKSIETNYEKIIKKQPLKKGGTGTTSILKENTNNISFTGVTPCKQITNVVEQPVHQTFNSSGGVSKDDVESMIRNEIENLRHEIARSNDMTHNKYIEDFKGFKSQLCDM